MTATLLISVEDLDSDRVSVSGDPFHHLFRVRRLEVGERLRLVDGCGRARWGEVQSLERGGATVRVMEEGPSLEPSLDLELIVGTPRSQRASWLVEKATEIGVTAIRFIGTDRSPRRLSESALERLARVARGAVEQSGRSRVPAVSGVHSWSDLETLLAGRPQRWFLDTRAAPGRGVEVGQGPACLVVGPEGGWTDRERFQLESSGCAALGLGVRTLRVETAAALGAFRLLVSSSVDTF